MQSVENKIIGTSIQSLLQIIRIAWNPHQAIPYGLQDPHGLHIKVLIIQGRKKVGKLVGASIVWWT